ncbi:hypothetical protein Sjap_023625 [Stephania japonica]|uniref:CCHC-type domain-containing protein n=1 Tax=Stephania japonica TaxID=461633 RepID=A0AAP0HJ52_9MAGN
MEYCQALKRRKLPRRSGITLENCTRPSHSTKKNFLKRKLYTLRMAESTSVTEHINAMNTLFSQLTSLSYKIESQERAELLLQSLPDSYDQLIIYLTNKLLTDCLAFDDVATGVLEKENRRKNKEDRQASSQQVEALTVMRGRSTERGPSGSHNHGRSKSKSKKNFKCYNCGKKGHWKKDCWSLKNSDPQGNVASTSNDGAALCCEAATTTKSRKKIIDVRIIDSGATYHMTSRREWFHHYEPILGGSVYSCNDHALKVIGIGTIMLKMYDDASFALSKKCDMWKASRRICYLWDDLMILTVKSKSRKGS